MTQQVAPPPAFYRSLLSACKRGNAAAFRDLMRASHYKLLSLHNRPDLMTPSVRSGSPEMLLAIVEAGEPLIDILHHKNVTPRNDFMFCSPFWTPPLMTAAIAIAGGTEMFSVKLVDRYFHGAGLSVDCKHEGAPWAVWLSFAAEHKKMRSVILSSLEMVGTASPQGLSFHFQESFWRCLGFHKSGLGSAEQLAEIERVVSFPERFADLDFCSPILNCRSVSAMDFFLSKLVKQKNLAQMAHFVTELLLHRGAMKDERFAQVLLSRPPLAPFAEQISPSILEGVYLFASDARFRNLQLALKALNLPSEITPTADLFLKRPSLPLFRKLLKAGHSLSLSELNSIAKIDDPSPFFLELEKRGFNWNCLHMPLELFLSCNGLDKLSAHFRASAHATALKNEVVVANDKAIPRPRL
jgi:hypothetical protein